METEAIASEFSRGEKAIAEQILGSEYRIKSKTVRIANRRSKQ